MKTIHDIPSLYLAFISLHLLIGHFGSTFVYKLRFSKNPFALYQKNNHSLHTKLSKLIALVSVVWAISIIYYAYLGELQTNLFCKPLIILPPFLGWFISSIGLMGMFASQINMNEAFRIGQDDSQTSSQTVLKTDGIYRYSRNPIYLFSSIALIGMSLWSVTLFTMLPLLIILLCIHGLVIAEEKFLLKRFNHDYQQYCQQVARYLSLRKGYDRNCN